jgi:hypothetical protein
MVIQQISAAGWKHAFSGIISDEILDAQIKRKLSNEQIEGLAQRIKSDGRVYIVAINASGKIVGFAAGGTQEWKENIPEDEKKQWQLNALYLDTSVIGDGKTARALVTEFAQRVASAGSNKFIGETLSGSRACKLYGLIGGEKIRESSSENLGNVKETRFEFNVNRFLK